MLFVIADVTLDGNIVNVCYGSGLNNKKDAQNK